MCIELYNIKEILREIKISKKNFSNLHYMY